MLNRRRFLAAVGGVAAAGLTTAGYAWKIEPHWYEVVERDLEIDHLPSALAGQTLEFLKPAKLGEAVRVTTRPVDANAWAQTIELAETHETLVTNICFTK